MQVLVQALLSNASWLFGTFRHATLLLSEPEILALNDTVHLEISAVVGSCWFFLVAVVLIW